MPYVVMILVLTVLLLTVLLLAAATAVRTIRFKKSSALASAGSPLSADLAGAKKLSAAVRIKTVSHTDANETDWNAFALYQEKIREMFPLVHQYMEKTAVNQYSLVYRWPRKTASSGNAPGETASSGNAPGETASASAKRGPVLFLAHIDVVPVEPATLADWTHDAFSGEFADGRIWGRGTLDIKIQMISLLEAAERLLMQGFSPSRDVYFAFGHDEEVGGRGGAIQISEYFARKGLIFDFVLDEGGCVLRNALEGVEKPMALIGVGEKGFANLEITVNSEGGHSSMPSAHSSLGILAQALVRLENHPAKPRLIRPVREFLKCIGPEMGLVNRIVLSNLWLFKPLFLFIFCKSKTGNALLRTTTAVTMAAGSPAPNVLPQQSVAVVNFRLLPGETGDDLLIYVKKILKGLPVTLKYLDMDNPSRISATDNEQYAFIERTARDIFGDVITAPYLVLGGTDARKYEVVSENIYRFTPYIIDSSELDKMHGTNENITVENVNLAIDFFKRMLETV